jgi:predicted dehydrogenase
MKFLVVGCGSIGRRHIRNLFSLGQRDVIACETSSERASQVNRELGIPVFLSAEEGLEARPEAVLICTPPAEHLAATLLAAKQGCHQLIEKPISHTGEGLDDLLREVRRRSLVTLVGYNWRFHPSFRRMKQLLAEGAIGDVLGARVNCGQYLPDWHPKEDYRYGYSAKRSLGGGILLDSHELDYLTWLLGNPQTLFCSVQKLSDLEIETEDTADLILGFDSHTQASVHLDYLQRPAGRSYEFFGSLGTMRWQLGQGLSLYKASTGQWESIPEPASYDLNLMYVEELRHLIECIQGSKRSLVDAERGGYVLRLILAAKESSQLQSSVSLP